MSQDNDSAATEFAANSCYSYGFGESLDVAFGRLCANFHHDLDDDKLVWVEVTEHTPTEDVTVNPSRTTVHDDAEVVNYTEYEIPAGVLAEIRTGAVSLVWHDEDVHGARDETNRDEADIFRSFVAEKLPQYRLGEDN